MQNGLSSDECKMVPSAIEYKKQTKSFQIHPRHIPHFLVHSTLAFI